MIHKLFKRLKAINMIKIPFGYRYLTIGVFSKMFNYSLAGMDVHASNLFLDVTYRQCVNNADNVNNASTIIVDNSQTFHQEFGMIMVLNISDCCLRGNENHKHKVSRNALNDYCRLQKKFFR